MTSLESLLSKGRAYGNSDDAEGIKLRSENIPLKAKKEMQKRALQGPTGEVQGMCDQREQTPLSPHKSGLQISVGHFSFIVPQKSLVFSLFGGVWRLDTSHIKCFYYKKFITLWESWNNSLIEI